MLIEASHGLCALHDLLRFFLAEGGVRCRQHNRERYGLMRAELRKLRLRIEFDLSNARCVVHLISDYVF